MSLDSRIQVDQIESYDPPNLAVQLIEGATVPSGKTLTLNGNATLLNVSTGSVTVTNDITVSGSITGTFSGDADNVSNLPVTHIGKAVAHTFIL